LAQKNDRFARDKNQSLEQLQEKLDNLDQRLDDIDTTVSAIAERAMSRPITLTMTCPGCGKIIEIAIVGNGKMTRQP
jgi:hypothetical protein